ncbi:MAG: BatA domain-containing protein [Lentisphaerales bacterium]|nr:BatA domain-containing protein [Lentisphaerales bacterium]
MTFIEPLLFWLFVPFILLPIIIHLINRMRYTPIKWAAMDFLFKAKRSSTKFARIREWLILACRCLALLFLAFTLARPLSGGWLGWALSGSSDTVIVLLDRSSSMSTYDESGQVNKVQRAVKMVRQSAEKMPAGTKFVVIDSGSSKAMIIDDLARLEDQVLFGVTDGGVSMKDMLKTAYQYIETANPGNCEIWLTSDLQMSSWQPGSEDWQTLNADFKKLKSQASFRVLGLSHQPAKNISISVKSVRRFQESGKSKLLASIQLSRSYTGPETVQITVNMNGSETARRIKITQESLLFEHKFKLPEGDTGGYGFFRLPEDRQPGDNISYFAYGPGVDVKTAIVSQQKYAKLLSLAAAPPRGQQSQAHVVDKNQVAGKNVRQYSLVILDNQDINDKEEAQLLKYVEKGGQLLVFPPVRKGKRLLKFIDPDEVQRAEKDYRVASWDEFQGPLANTLQGESLPLNKLSIVTRQLSKDPGQVLAAYEDGQPFLSRYGLGKGSLYYCSSSVAADWSDLYKGPILLPMLNRLVRDGAKKFSTVSTENCRYEEAGKVLEVLLGDKSQAIKSLHAGVYKRGDEILVLNRPAFEDSMTMVDEEKIKDLFDGLEFSMFNQSSDKTGSETQSELFSIFAVLMLVLLVIEAFMTLNKPLKREEAV